MVRHNGENLINVEGVAIDLVLSFRSAPINSSELDAPEANCFSSDRDTSLRQWILDILMAMVETNLEPNSIENAIGRESQTLLSVQGPSVSISAHLLGNTKARINNHVYFMFI